LGITVDNLPTLYAWTRQMGELWFPVLSDFWPHGEAAQRFGVLRTDGTAERALFIIDKAGIIRFIQVSDINRRPNLKDIADALIGNSVTHVERRTPSHFPVFRDNYVSQ
jgi:alkyl hydroperoxide reductase subunit AhpC